MKRALIALVLTAAATAAHAQQSAPCACTAPRSDGQLSSVIGSVSVLSNAGLSPILGATPVAIGSRVITGPDGSAVLTIGRTCQLNLGPNSEADVSVRERGICVRVAQTAPTPVAGLTAFDPALLAGGVVVLGGVGAGIGVAVSGGGKGNGGGLFPGVPQVSP